MADRCWYEDVCGVKGDSCGPTCVRYAEMLNLFQMSNIPRYRWYPEKLVPGKGDRESFVYLRDIKNDIKNWVQSGNNLYLFSDTFGNGKTSWAVKLMSAYFNQVWRGNCFKTRGIFISVPEFFDRERLRMDNQDEDFKRIRQSLIECDLVIWDDVSSVKMTDYASATFFNFVDARVIAHRANIFTGNLGEERLKDFVGGRLASRIWNTSDIIEFVGEDRRGV